jgi:hypothetical protein
MHLRRDMHTRAVHDKGSSAVIPHRSTTRVCVPMNMCMSTRLPVSVCASVSLARLAVRPYRRRDRNIGRPACSTHQCECRTIDPSCLWEWPMHGCGATRIVRTDVGESRISRARSRPVPHDLLPVEKDALLLHRRSGRPAHTAAGKVRRRTAQQRLQGCHQRLVGRRHRRGPLCVCVRERDVRTRTQVA